MLSGPDALYFKQYYLSLLQVLSLVHSSPTVRTTCAMPTIIVITRIVLLSYPNHHHFNYNHHRHQDSCTNIIIVLIMP